MRFQKSLSLMLCALVALIGSSLEAQALAVRVKGNPFVGLSAIQQSTSAAVYYGVKNESPTAGELVVGPQVIQVDVRPDGSWTHTPVFTGELKTTFVSLGIQGGAIFATTLEGEVIIASMATGDYITYGGLVPGVRYGLLFDDPSMTEIGVYDTTDPYRLVHYLNRASARYMRTESPEAVAASCSTIMALGLRRVWDVDFRSSSGSTRNYLVVDSGNSALAPRLLQVSYDFTSMASSVTVIATGTVGENWFGGQYLNPNFFVTTKAGQLKRINVSTGVITTVSATATQPLFYSDLAARNESGVPQVYCVDYYGRLRKVNGNTGATTLLAQLPGACHSITIDGSLLVITGQESAYGFKASIWRVNFSGSSVTLFAQGPAFSGAFYGIADVSGSNNYHVIQNNTGSVIQVNSFAGPWSFVCSASGGQNQEIIRDGSRMILGDFSQGSIQFY